MVKSGLTDHWTANLFFESYVICYAQRKGNGSHHSTTMLKLKLMVLSKMSVFLMLVITLAIYYATLIYFLLD